LNATYVEQVNEVPNDNGTFLDIVFTNAPVDVSDACADSPLLKLDRHHRAYEIEMRVCCCEFEAMESRSQRYMFRMADCAAILNELDEVDWFSLFAGKRWIVASTCSTSWYGAAFKVMYPGDFLVVVGKCHESQVS
jgi:hypothetical protein